MEILLAKQAGFCFGVKRATQMAFEAADKGEETFTLGPIIHSPQVVQRLEEMGVKVLKDLADLDTGTIIIRSHGVASEEISEATRKELEIVDATCPFVKKAQEHVKSLSECRLRLSWWSGMRTIPKCRGSSPTQKVRSTWSVPVKRRRDFPGWGK